MKSNLQQRATELMVIYIRTKQAALSPLPDNSLQELIGHAELLGECLGILQGFLAIDDAFTEWVEQELLSLEAVLGKGVPAPATRTDLN